MKYNGMPEAKWYAVLEAVTQVMEKHQCSPGDVIAVLPEAWADCVRGYKAMGEAEIAEALGDRRGANA